MEEIKKKALEMYLSGWCKDCNINYTECVIKGICKAYEIDKEVNKEREKSV